MAACSQAPDTSQQIEGLLPPPLDTQQASLQTILPISVASSTQTGQAGAATTISRFDLGVVSISVGQGATWQINRPIEIVFDRAIDFSTVHPNTLQIVNSVGIPATGFFELPQADTVRFVPTCPTNDSFSDGGFQVGADYSLAMPGVNQTPSGITLRGAAGSMIRDTVSVDFTIPNSTDPSVLFLDTVSGPPRVLLIPGVGGPMPGSSLASTYLEVGGDDTNRYYFGSNGLGAFEIPLNLYSDPDSSVSLLLHLNQPVLNTSSNIQGGTVSFEHEGAPGVWSPIPTRVAMEQNCSGSGAVLRVDPLGILPQGGNLRVLVKQGFMDLVGDSTTQDNGTFAPMVVRTLLDPGGMPEEGADEWFEPFLVGGASEGSWEDTTFASEHPHAKWGADQTLAPAFGFDGTGGPGGDFDYFVPSGQTVIINTVFASIVGGPGGTPTAVQNVVGGVMDVRDLYVPAGSTLIFSGPNPATILASGTV
ncbi:MAG: hypothetical protein P1V35_17435, partial [Planctomycetota bacterium]|nr:hypothetical protein [Planctomycetota bacterium]